MHIRLHNVANRALVVTGLGALVATGLTACSGGQRGAHAHAPTWSAHGVHVVSRIMVGAGVAAVTSLAPGGRLQTAVFDLDDGAELWTHPATMAGRVPGLGVQPPAVVGRPGDGLVVAVEPVAAAAGAPRTAAVPRSPSTSPTAGTPVTPGRPATPGRSGGPPASPGAGRPGAVAAPGPAGAHIALVARDARTGAVRWTRPIGSTFGPAGCGGYVCVSEQTALPSARFVVLDPADGHALWRMPGIGQVEWTDGTKIVVLRLSARPVLESRDLRTGARQWSFAPERALGGPVSLAAGWGFGVRGGDLIGEITPYRKTTKDKPTAFGFFSVRLSDGTLRWARQRVVRVYPSGSPAAFPIVREVDAKFRYSGFAQLDPATGRTLSEMPAARVPNASWWLAFPAELSGIGFLVRGKTGTMWSLHDRRMLSAGGAPVWSFCTIDPKPLKISGQPAAFYPTAPLCAYDLRTGKPAGGHAVPPAWYTGRVDGWRLWHDEQGDLHAIKDGAVAAPGMYG